MSNIKCQKSNVKCQMSKVKSPMSKAAPVSVSHSGGGVQDLPRVQNMFRDDSGNGKGFLILFEKSSYRCSIRWKYQTKSLRTTRRFSSCSTRFLHDFTFFSKLIKTLVPGWRWNRVNQGTGSGHEITWWIKQFIITRITPWTESNMIKLNQLSLGSLRELN